MVMYKIPPGEKGEVRIKGRSGKNYLLTYAPLKEIRTLYLIESTGVLKKIATGKTPTELYPKAL